MDLDLALALAGPRLLSLACLVNLWRGGGRTWPKLFWSVVAVAPFVGPLLYVVLREPPPPSDPIDRPPETPPDHL